MVSKVLNRVKNSPFLKYNLIFFTANILVGLVNYFYNFTVARLLGPSEFGIIASLLSLVYILMIPAQVIMTIAVKFTSQFRAQEKSAQISALLSKFSLYLFVFGLVSFLIFSLASPVVASFLNIPSPLLVILLGLSLLVAFLSPLNRGVLQGMQRFVGLSLNMGLEVITKLFLAIILILLGLKTAGAILAISLAAMVGYVQSFYPLRDFLKKSSLEIPFRSIVAYSPTVLLAFLGITLLQNTDVLLVKHFFPPAQAGLYAAVSLMGKIILFVTLPVAGVMFPIVAERHEKNEKHHHLVNFSFLVGLGLAGIILLGYVLFPKLAISILFGKKYLGGSSYLIWLGLVGTLHSLCFILINYFLSVRNATFLPVLLAVATIEALLIYFFHFNIYQVITVVILSLSLLLIFLLILYLQTITRTTKQPAARESLGG